LALEHPLHTFCTHLCTASFALPPALPGVKGGGGDHLYACGNPGDAFGYGAEKSQRVGTMQMKGFYLGHTTRVIYANYSILSISLRP